MGEIIMHNPCGVDRMLDFLRARDGSLVLPSALLASYLAQSAGEGSYAYGHAGEAPLVIAGVWHGESSIAWFMVRAGSGNLLPRLVRRRRGDLMRELERSASGRVEVHVVPGHRPGERLAAMLGFAPRGIVAGYRIWEVVHVRSSGAAGHSADRRGNDALHP